MSGLLRTVDESFATCAAPIFLNLVVMLSVAFKVTFILGFVVRAVRAHNPLGTVSAGMAV